jgi:hypothetical protein
VDAWPIASVQRARFILALEERHVRKILH